jgi:hypothetical protein
LNFTGNLGDSEVFPTGSDSYVFIGISGFYTSSTSHYLWYDLSFGTMGNGSYGLIMPTPNIGVGLQSVSYYTVSYFYVEKASCPNSSYTLDISGANPMCIIGCTIPNCITCVPINACQQCNYLSSYYLLPNGTCALCNSANMFINTSDPTYPCTLCTLTGCTTCSSLTQCSVCNNGLQYFLNPTDNLCHLCSTTLSHCSTCSAYFVCQTCTSPYLLNSTDTTATGQCATCSLIGCLNCLTISLCQICDYPNNYGILLNQTCQFCNSSIQ